MPSHPLNVFEIQKYYQNIPKLNGVFSKYNLPKIKDGTYVINLNYWIAFHVEPFYNVTSCESFRV